MVIWVSPALICRLRNRSILYAKQISPFNATHFEPGTHLSWVEFLKRWISRQPYLGLPMQCRKGNSKKKSMYHKIVRKNETEISLLYRGGDFTLRQFYGKLIMVTKYFHFHKNRHRARFCERNKVINNAVRCCSVTWSSVRNPDLVSFAIERQSWKFTAFVIELQAAESYFLPIQWRVHLDFKAAWEDLTRHDTRL